MTKQSAARKSLLLRKVSPLSAEDDTRLIYLAQAGSLEARNELLEHHLPFMLHVARDYVSRYKLRFVERDDLAHVCVLGTIHAIFRYNPSKARGRFVYYAKWWMRDYMKRAVNDYRLYKVPLTTKYMFDAGQLDNIPRRAKTRLAVEWFRHIQPIPDEWSVADKMLGPEDEASLREECLLRGVVYDACYD